MLCRQKQAQSWEVSRSSGSHFGYPHSDLVCLILINFKRHNKRQVQLLFNFDIPNLKTVIFQIINIQIVLPFNKTGNLNRHEALCEISNVIKYMYAYISMICIRGGQTGSLVNIQMTEKVVQGTSNHVFT